MPAELKTDREVFLNLLGSLSHELRTPMGAIIGFSRLLLDTALSSEQRDGLEVINRNAYELLKLLNDLIDFVKLEAGKIELNPAPFDLHQCLEDALTRVKPRALEKGLAIRTTIEPDVPQIVLADGGRFEQLLLNLLSNAVKFTQQGEVVLSVATDNTHKAQAPLIPLHVAIRDTGMGISADGLSRLFKLGVRSSATSYSVGSGLGLPISKHLITLMGGTLWAESAGEDQGATFHFTIPLQLSNEIPINTPKPIPPIETSESEFAQHHPLQILLVDHYPHFTPLEQLGYTFDTAISGFEALGRWQLQPYAVVLLNIHLPGGTISGLETAQRLRTIHTTLYPAHPQPYIIALHNPRDTESTRAECLAAGMNAYLEHFVKIPELKTALATAWQSQHTTL